MVVASYQWRHQIVVDWGPTTPFNYDFFIVRWDRDGANIGQVDVKGGQRETGRYTLSPDVDGRYEVRVEGCDDGTFGSTCRQGWAITTHVDLRPPDLPPTTCTVGAHGLIGERWNDLDGQHGPLGCPTGDERDVPGRRGRIQTFEHGEIAWSPDQGAHTVVAAYADADNIIVNWGDTSPLNYDKFVVTWDRDGGVPQSQDVSSYIDRTYGFMAIRHPVLGTYTVRVHGCDVNPTDPNDVICRDGDTIPVHARWDMPISVGGCPTAPYGFIGQKWADLGGSEGRLGCPTSDERDAEGRRGRINDFQHGQVTWSPDQGDALTVAIYQDGGRVVVQWAPTYPFHYDKFVVRMTLPSGQTTQEDVDGYDSGSWSVPAGTPGKYTFIVEGCDNRVLHPSACLQGFTVPVSVEVPPAPAPVEPSQDCPLKPTPPILARWIATRAKDGPLGCPTGSEATLPGANARTMTFVGGQIVASFTQGDAMTVAIYQQYDGLKMDWGDTYPYHYDFFVVRLSREGMFRGQVDVTGGPDRSGSTTFFPMLHPGDDDDRPLVDSSGIYSVIVEGCDSHAGSSKCRQKFTVPVQAVYKTFGTINMNSVPHPTTVEQALAGVGQRTVLAANALACEGPMPPTTLEDEDRFVTTAIAKLYSYQHRPDGAQDSCEGNRLSKKVEVNDALRTATITSRTGTTSDKFFCPRTGEYDVVLNGYIPIAYAMRGLLAPDVRYRLLRLLDKTGPHDPDDDDICGVANVEETENHRLNIESARYLTNQLNYDEGPHPYFDNNANGMTDFLLDRLQGFLKNDFKEFNARPYARYSLTAVQNLYDYARDPRVKTAAQLVLDYVSAKYAVSASESRRDSPFRRLADHYRSDLFHEQSDPLKDRMMAIYGPPIVLDELSPAGYLPRGSASELMLAGISTYRPSDVVSDLVLNPDHRSFYQRIKHAGAEVYSAEPDFLITGGGQKTGPAYTAAWVFSTSVDKGIVVPTSLMPTGHGISIDQMIHFAGGSTKDPDNTCVAPRFACGGPLTIPAQYMPPDKPQCWSRNGQWIFIDSASESCNAAPDKTYGFYVAARQADSDGVGLFEAVPKRDLTGVTLVQFAATTLAHNTGRSYPRATVLQYTTYAGIDIYFGQISPFGTHVVISTGVPAIDQTPFLSDDAPLAHGTIINSDGRTGRITIDNPALNRRLTLDFTDRANPRRIASPLS